jgi:hypothetical protein
MAVKGITAWDLGNKHSSLSYNVLNKKRLIKYEGQSKYIWSFAIIDDFLSRHLFQPFKARNSGQYQNKLDCFKHFMKESSQPFSYHTSLVL